MLWVPKKTSQCSFEHPKWMLKLMGKNILKILLFKAMNLVTNLMSALLFPQFVSVLSFESVFFESSNLKENSHERGICRS